MDRLKVGDRVRRRGKLAELFGDDTGIVNRIEGDGATVRVDFARHTTLLHETQVICATSPVRFKRAGDFQLVTFPRIVR